MDITLFALIGALAMALIALVVGAFFSGERINSERFERKLSDEESKKNRKILEANMAARDLSDADISRRLSELNRANIIVYPGRGKDQP